MLHLLPGGFVSGLNASFPENILAVGNLTGKTGKTGKTGNW
jgi:hypothetical protein